MAAFSPKAFSTQVRKKVSQDRHRFQDFDYDLDLSYITTNVIAMGFPSSGIESLWRNNIDEVCSMLKKYHGNNYRIWNLSGRKYDYEKFDTQIYDYPFPDHHNPPLELQFKIVQSIHEYLSQDPKNVSVVHCVGGKGRTGTIIASFLLYCGLHNNTLDALKFFADKRSSISKGVIQAAQIRYTQYFGDIISGRVKPQFQRYLILKTIEMNPPPMWSSKSTQPLVEVFSTHTYPKKLLYTSQNAIRTLYSTDGPCVWNVNCLIQSDILISLSEYKGLKKKPKKKFRVSFNVGFVDTMVMKLRRADLDVEDKNFKKKWDASGFEMTLTFEQPTPEYLKARKDVLQLTWDPEIQKYLEQLNKKEVKSQEPIWDVEKVKRMLNTSDNIDDDSSSSLNSSGEQPNSPDILSSSYPNPKSKTKRFTIGTFRKSFSVEDVGYITESKIETLDSIDDIDKVLEKWALEAHTESVDIPDSAVEELENMIEILEGKP